MNDQDLQGDKGLHEENDKTNLSSNFIKDFVQEDLSLGKYGEKVHTRFPPEPNGYLHIGHAKAICLNFGIASEFAGQCNLRFDDTNPSKEEVEYVESIQEDVRWLGFNWGPQVFFASDYFEQLYRYAEQLIKLEKAYVCDLSAQEMRDFRGTLTEPGRISPHRSRSVSENLDLFRRMRAGEFADGARTLRAKIEMASPNLNMRDPVLYRIQRSHHHRTGDAWCIYPMYDYAHPLSDAIEGITHSLCTLEFENHRPLYDWVLRAVAVCAPPRQIEFARLNLTYTVMSKRKLRQLVEEGFVKGWDDPRMPTICGLRRRGYTPESIRDFAERIGVAKSNSTVDISLLEHCLREDLNRRAPRVMVVLRPIKLVIDNYPEGQVEMLEAVINPEAPESGSRELPFSREIYIEQDDFMEIPTKKYFRLSPGAEVRLKHAYIIKCQSVVKDEAGTITEIHCTYDPETKSGQGQEGRKVKGTLHWVSAGQGIGVEIRLYDHLFDQENPEGEEGGDFTSHLNPRSLEILAGCVAEPGLAKALPGSCFQFLRQGYFAADRDTTPAHPVFNRTVSLKDSWGKTQK